MRRKLNVWALRALISSPVPTAALSWIVLAVPSSTSAILIKTVSRFASSQLRIDNINLPKKSTAATREQLWRWWGIKWLTRQLLWEQGCQEKGNYTATCFMHKKYQLHASGNQPLLSYQTPGLVPFFLNKKFKDFSKAFKDTFPIFHGLHSVQKRALSLCLLKNFHNMSNLILKVFLCLLFLGTWESGLDKVSTEI